MPRFSERVGASPPKTLIYINSMPDELRTSIWNLVLDLYSHDHEWDRVATVLARGFFKFPVDSLPHFANRKREWVKEAFYNLSWAEAFDFAEFLAQNHRAISTHREGMGGRLIEHDVKTKDLLLILNKILERERSGYRFVNGQLIPISDEVEVEAVASAASLAGSAVNGASQHIRSALESFSRRPEPDYRNTIAQSIMAIESIAKQLGTSKGDGITSALRALEEKAGIHGALRQAFEKMYGYTSDESGIRHAILDEPTVGYEEAKYMLVACSAFANYLAGKARAAGLL